MCDSRYTKATSGVRINFILQVMLLHLASNINWLNVKPIEIIMLEFLELKLFMLLNI